MDDIRMTGELRTDLGCEVTGLPAQRWGEAVFKVQNEEIVLEISVEKDVIVGVMLGEEAAWRGTLKGFKLLLKEASKRK